MTKLYGNAPIDLGLVGDNIECDEMMFYLYLPIKTPDQILETLCDDRLSKYKYLISKVYHDICREWSCDRWMSSYVYLTVKTLHVSKSNMGQREGYHSDGFMTDDINYIWYTDVPTVFWQPSRPLTLSQDHNVSMQQMKDVCDVEVISGKAKEVRYPERHLLRLDETVIHKTDMNSDFEGVRTFVKISISDKPYALKGNSVNPLVPLGVEYKERKQTRNCPQGN